jgi:cell division protein ZapD
MTENWAADEHDDTDNRHESRFKSEQLLVKQKVIYEQPLNERMRIWLRLEYLFEEMLYRVRGPSVWDSRAALAALVDILEFTARNDCKPDLIKDLERHAQDLNRWKQSPKVDEQRLNNLLNKINNLIEQLGTPEQRLSRLFDEHYLIASVRQRSNIPGGTSRIDVPAYHHWLQNSPKQRLQDLSEWINYLTPLREGIDLNLYLIRQNAIPTHEVAQGGFFQTKLDSKNEVQLVRVSLSGDHPCYPEMSGGKHRFTLRFFEHAHPQERPRATEQDVHFELACCSNAN